MTKSFHIEAGGVSALPYYILKRGVPVAEYIHDNPAGSWVVNDGGRLRYCSGVVIGEEERGMRPGYRQLADAGIVMSPSGMVEGIGMEELWELCREYLKGVVAFRGEEELTVATSYAVMTWFTWRYDAIPYLRFTGDYGTGKTTALRGLTSICYRGLNVSGTITAAGLFRVVDAVQGTMMIDEADWKGNGLESQVVKILNHGYSRGVSVIRLGRGSEPEAFQVFGPKVIATRKRFKDEALESRCVDIRMEQSDTEGLAGVDDGDVVAGSERIRNGLLYQRLKLAKSGGDWSLFGGGGAGEPRKYAPRVRQLAVPLFGCTPGGRRREIEEYFEGVNMGYLETRDNGAEAQVRRIIRGELRRQNNRLTLAQLYGQLTYDCRVKVSSRKIARIAETLGCEKRHTRDGVVFWFNSF